MPFEKISDTEVLSTDGVRITYNKSAVIYLQGSRYLTIPMHDDGPPGEMHVLLTKMSSWMENGQPCEVEGTLNMSRIRARISDALTLLGRKFTFDR